MTITDYKQSYVSAEIRNLEERLRPVIEDGQSDEAMAELAHIDQRVARLCYDCHTEQWPDALREALQSLYDQMGYAADYEIPRPGVALHEPHRVVVGGVSCNKPRC